MTEELVEYERLLQMLDSSDKENMVVALTLLNEMPYKDNVAKMMLLRKESRTSWDSWKEHAPLIVGELTKNVPIGAMFDFQTVLDYVGNDKKGIELCVARIAEDMRKSLVGRGIEVKRINTDMEW